MEIKTTDKIWDIIYTQWKRQQRKPKYILGTDKNCQLKWLDYDQFTHQRTL